MQSQDYLPQTRVQQQARATDPYLYSFFQYTCWLTERPLSKETKRAYASRVKLFLSYISRLGKTAQFFEHPNFSPEMIDQYRTYLADELESAPRSVNSVLTAIDNYLRFLGIEPIKADRTKTCSKKAPKTLTLEEQMSFLKTVEELRSARNRAIALLIFHTGIRIGECAALDLSDLSDCGRTITVRHLRNNWISDRTLSLPNSAAEAILTWLNQRGTAFGPALFTNRSGARLSTSSIDLVIRTIGWNAHLQLSARILRNSCLANLATSTNAIEVARMAGFTNLGHAKRFRHSFSNK